MIKGLRDLAYWLEFWNCRSKHLWNSFLENRKVKTTQCTFMEKKCTQCEVYETSK